jgi:hypothetical protein
MTSKHTVSPACKLMTALIAQWDGRCYPNGFEQALERALEQHPEAVEMVDAARQRAKSLADSVMPVVHSGFLTELLRAPRFS